MNRTTAISIGIKIVGIKTIAVVAILAFLIFLSLFMFLSFSAVLLTVDDFVPTINLGFLSGEPTFTARDQIPGHFFDAAERAQGDYNISWAVLAAISKKQTNFGEEGNYYFNITDEKLNEYGVDADGDGKIKKESLYDSVYTVANFLEKHNYKDDPEGALEAYLRASASAEEVSAEEVSAEEVSAEEIIQLAIAYSYDTFVEITGRTTWPVPEHTTISSGFGPRKHPIYGIRRLHKGIDIPAPRGAPVVTFTDGKVTFAGRAGGYGNLIIIEHHTGMHTYYAHLSEMHVEYRDKVRTGQVIGRIGNTGVSTGSHLHFEIRINKKPVDPMPYLKSMEKAT